MAMTPKVSVIVPNYNHRQYLHQRIDSVLHQTYRDFEIILLDDKSPDQSIQVLQEYANNPLVRHIVLNDENSGSPFKQWQRGTNLARGKWIWIAESDDYAEPDFLEKMMAAAEANPDAGLIYCDAGIVTRFGVEDATFTQIKNNAFSTTRWSHDYVNSGKDEIENYILLESTINNASAVIFNAGIFTRMNPFDIKLKYIGDKYAYVKVLAFSDVVYVKDRLSYYRDPFNTKHAGKIIHYVHEQFKVFDWVYRNMKEIDKKKFFRAFFQNTSCSLFRDWNLEKVKIFVSIFATNEWLFTRWVLWNFARPFITRMRRGHYHKRTNIPV